MTPIPVLSRGLSAGTGATGSGVPGFLAAERRTRGFCCFLSLVVSPAPQGSRAAAFPLNVAPAPPPPRPGTCVCHMPRLSGYWPSLRESVGGWEPGPQKPGMLSCLRGTLASGPCGRRTVTLLLGGPPAGRGSRGPVTRLPAGPQVTSGSWPPCTYLLPCSTAMEEHPVITGPSPSLPGRVQPHPSPRPGDAGACPAWRGPGPVEPRGREHGLCLCGRIAAGPDEQGDRGRVLEPLPVFSS